MRTTRIKSKQEEAISVLQLTDTHLFADEHGTLLGIKTSESFKAVIESIVNQGMHFDFIMVFLISLTLFQEFDVLSFIFLLAFVAAAVLIIVDLARNKKLLNAEVNQSQQDAQKSSEESESNNFDSEK